MLLRVRTQNANERRSIRLMTNDVLVEEVVEGAPPREREAVHTLAPWWHTVAILAVMAAWALAGRSSAHTSLRDHLSLYVSSSTMSWMLLGTAVAGLYQRGKFFSEMLRRSGWHWFVDTVMGGAIYIGFFISVAIVMMVFTLIRHDTSLWQKPATEDQRYTTQGDESSKEDGNPAQAKADGKTPEKKPLSRLFDQRTLKAIAPRNGTELLGWLLLSLSAGICEELVFRGYLLRQSIAWIQRMGVSPKIAMGVAAVLTSLVFGSLHLYEGVGGAAIIAFLGLVYAVASLGLGNLRAVIAAHVMQDFFAGLVLFALHRAR